MADPHILCVHLMRRQQQQQQQLYPPSNPLIIPWIYNHGWLLIRTRYARREIQILYINKTKISRTRYQYQRPGTTNHPHYLGTGVVWRFSSHDNTSRRNYYVFIDVIYLPPPFWLLLCISCYVWWYLFVCAWCSWWRVLIFFHLGLLLIFVLRIVVIYSEVLFFHLVTHTHGPIPTHPRV